MEVSVSEPNLSGTRVRTGRKVSEAATGRTSVILTIDYVPFCLLIPS